MDGCLKCKENANHECNSGIKLENSCIFSGESEYDIKEILRIHDLIFSKETEEYKVKVVLLNGGLGSGKTYKLEKALNYKEREKESISYDWFDSFQTGFSQNFIYILLLKLIQENKVRNITKICVLNFKNMHAHFVAIPFLISMTIILYTFLNVFDFSHLPIGINIMYTLLIIIMYLIIMILLPYLLTIRKEYGTVSRSYYFNLVANLLGDILVIDDFERLNNEQRRQVYEFIDFLRTNDGKEKISKIILLGDLGIIEQTEEWGNNSSVNLISEPFVSKYYDQKISLKNWTESFTDRHKLDMPNIVINNAEQKHISEFLNYISPIFSRREYIRFTSNIDDKIIESFEEALVKELKESKPLNFESLSEMNFNKKILLYVEPYENIEQLIECKVPSNKTIYIDSKEPVEHRVKVNKTLADITSVLYNKNIKYWDKLIKSLDEQNGNIGKKMNFFTSQYQVKGFKKAYFDLISKKKYKYKFADNVDDFYALNRYIIGEKYSGDTVLKALSEKKVNEVSVLTKMTKAYSENIMSFPIKEFLDDSLEIDGYIEEEIKDSYGGQRLFDLEIINFASQYYNFKDNLVFNIINEYKDKFNLSEALNAYDIVHAQSSGKILKLLTENTDIDLLVKFQVENKVNTRAFNLRMALIMLIIKQKGILKNLDSNKYKTAEWYEAVNHIYTDLDSISSENINYIRKIYSFISLDTLIDLKIKSLPLNEIIKIYEACESNSDKLEIHNKVFSQMIENGEHDILEIPLLDPDLIFSELNDIL